MERVLLIFKLSPGARASGSRTSVELLPRDIASQRARSAVAEFPNDPEDLWRIKMRPEPGYISLVSHSGFVVDLCCSFPRLQTLTWRVLQGLKCHPSRPPVLEERQINRLHAEAVKRRKDAAEVKAERKRKRKEKHDKACKIARSEGKPRPATPESTDEEEDAPDAEGHLLGDDGAAVGASSPPTYQWDVDEGVPAAPGETRTAAESLADPSLEGAERESPPQAAGEETPVLTALRFQANPRVTPSGQSSRGGAVPRARRSGTGKWSMSARSG